MPAYPTPTVDPVLPVPCAQAGAGVPGGNGKTGPFFGLVDWKQTKTFFPLFRVGRYLFPDTLM